MAQVDYFGIQQAIQTQLSNSLTTQNVSINIEPIDDCDSVEPWIGIYLEEAVREVLTIGGSTPHEITATFVIECFQFDINEFRNACERRDDFIKEVEEVLLLDRTFSGAVTVSEITKVSFDIGKLPDDVGFYVGGEIFLETRVRG
jgi:hypothetical protein